LDIHYGELLGYGLFIFAHGGAGLMKTSESELVGDKLSRGRIVERCCCAGYSLRTFHCSPDLKLEEKVFG
jgi:hypothetical protein